MKYFYLIIFFIFLTPRLTHGQDLAADSDEEYVSAKTFWSYTGTGVAVITAWGVVNWDYFSRSPHSHPEGWFGQDTSYGGSDKLGHAYSGFVLTHFLAHSFAKDRPYSAGITTYSAISACLILSYMEYGDSYSDYGFSPQDFIANLIGCGMGYVHTMYPAISDRFDFRWEYGRHPNRIDFMTDYDNSKYLLAAKFSGFEFSQNTIAKYVEVHFGYYTRGYLERDEPNERYRYIGFGLNLSHLFEEHGKPKVGNILRYLQVPHTYLAVDAQLD